MKFWDEHSLILTLAYSLQLIHTRASRGREVVPESIRLVMSQHLLRDPKEAEAVPGRTGPSDVRFPNGNDRLHAPAALDYSVRLTAPEAPDSAPETPQGPKRPVGRPRKTPVQNGNETPESEESEVAEEESDRSYWLMKAEPESRIEKGVDVKFSIDDLQAAEKPEPWDGKSLLLGPLQYHG